MQPIHELLDRIYCDPEFGRGCFEIGYCEGKEKEVVRVPFNVVTQLPGNKFSFHVLDEDGLPNCVPMDLVQEIYKDRELIWKRKVLIKKDAT